MAWTSWITPVVVGGLMLFAKSKASAAFRWIMSDAGSVKSMPVALLLTKISSGEILPAPPAGFTWNSIEVNFAASPFASPQTLIINVLQPAPGAAPVAAAPSPVSGAAGFLTSQSLVAQAKGMQGFLTTQEILPAGLNGFLSKQAFNRANQARRGMGDLIDRRSYLYAPQTAPDFGGFATEEALKRSPHYPPHRGGGIGATDFNGNWCGTGRYQGAPANGGVLGKLGAELRAKGLILAPVGQHGICKGDYVVTTDGALYVAVGHAQFKQLHPTAGYVGPLKTPFQSAYGVRRA